MPQRVRVLIQSQRCQVVAIHAHGPPDPAEPDRPGKCTYQMPGGDVLPDENMKEAAIRLLREQTGLIPGDMAWIYEAEEDGIPTVTLDTDIKTRRYVKQSREKLIQFVDPSYLIEGQGAGYNKALFEFLGLDLTKRDEENEEPGDV